MNCNCLSELESKIKDHVQPKVKAPIKEVTCLNVSFVLSGTPHLALTIPFSVKADAPGYRSAKGK